MIRSAAGFECGGGQTHDGFEAFGEVFGIVKADHAGDLLYGKPRGGQKLLRAVHPHALDILHGGLAGGLMKEPAEIGAGHGAGGGEVL